MGLIHRLRQWYDPQKARPVLEPPDDAGGRDGELFLHQRVASPFRFKDALLLAGRTYLKPELVEMAGRIPTRPRWSRGRFRVLVKALTGLGSLGSVYLGQNRFGVSTVETVMLHAAGDVESRTVRRVELIRSL